MKLGLTLSGGGIKGAFHLGVIQCLKEEGVEFDIISGTSIGSVVGLLYSLGLSPKEIKEDLIKVKFNSLFAFFNSIGKAGLISPNILKEVLIEKIIKKEKNYDLKFKDLSMPLNVTATEMSSGMLKIFNIENTPEQSVFEAILASSSYPMIFSPVEIDGALYSDGGILNNFPTELLKNKVNYSLGIFLSPKGFVSKENLTTSKAIVTRALQLQGLNEEMKKFKECNDVITNEELSMYGAFDVSNKNINELFDLGYRTIKENKELLKKIKRISDYKKELI